VGEMRDLETISMAITAAETGHLVLATLHTRGAAQSIDRIVDVFPAYQQEQIRVQLADTLEIIISQVLVPAKDRKKRYLATEVMVATSAIRHNIRDRKTFQIPTIIETGVALGMQTLDKSLKNLVELNRISREDALPWVADKSGFNNQ
jgi:twitching motility protein PilT